MIDYNEVFTDILNKDAWSRFAHPQYWDGKKDKLVTQDYKISICTTCMDRLDDLKMTLPKNIEDNIDYPNIEFVVLDYNSFDGLADWIKSDMQTYIDQGILNFYRTDEPKTYSMAHSRNIAFKLAQGHIINNVDADNFTEKGFAKYLNLLAHQVPEQAVFAKGKRMLHGRLGFYKNEFINLLGGYDEIGLIQGYGHDDKDLLHRAFGLNFQMVWWGGKYYRATPNHKKHQMDNFQNKDWKYTEKCNKMLSFFSLFYGLFKTNRGGQWGKATVVRNFLEEIQV